MCIGIGGHEYWCICAIIGLLKKKQSPEHSVYEEQRAAYRATQMIQRLLSLQDNYSAAATLASLPNMVCYFTLSPDFERQVLIVPAKPISAPTGLLGNGNGNGNGIEFGGQMNGTDILEVVEHSKWSMYGTY